jgi:glucose-1-phosphate thymidylyltransferase
LIPAAGTADRIAPSPFSKELYPIGFQAIGAGCGAPPKVVSQYLLEKMRLANIAEYFGDSKALSMHLAYLIMDLPFEVPYTLDQAYPFVKDATIVFGFPDIIFQPDDAFVHLLKRQSETNADVVLGIYPTDQPHKVDMVEVSPNGRVRNIRIKPAVADLDFTWTIAVWMPDFTLFMHEYILNEKITIERESDVAPPIESKELFLGDVIQAAMKNNKRVSSVTFTNSKYLDIGSPEDLIKATQMATEVLEKF